MYPRLLIAWAAVDLGWDATGPDPSQLRAAVPKEGISSGPMLTSKARTTTVQGATLSGVLNSWSPSADLLFIW